MICGRMRNRVVIEKGTETPDDYGQPVIAWATFATRWAQITPLRGDERVQALQLDAKLTHKVLMRWDSLTKQIEPGLFRIRYGKRADGTTDRIFDVNAAINIREQDEQLELHCTEAV